jgi:predicted permease
MQWFTNLTSGLKALFHKRHTENELDEELESYLQASELEKRRAGVAPDAAHRLAVIEMGSRNAVKHQIWASRWEATFDSILQDLRISLRTLAKSPGFTMVALLSLALGIGANTAIFTLIHQVLLHNLPVRAPEQLVSFDKADGGGVLGGVDLGYYGMFPWSFARQLQASPGPFQGIASYGSFSEKVSIRPPTKGAQGDDSAAILVPANLVSGNFFSLLGAQALLGRTINNQDDATPGSGAVAVLSYHLWRQSFSADPSILGRTIVLNNTPFAVIGVMPDGFHGLKLEPEPTGIWTPISMQAVVLHHPSFLTPDGPFFLHMFARLSSQAVSSKAAYAQSQLWLNQQVRTATRANEGAAVTPARQHEIDRISVPLVSAQHGVSPRRGVYGDSLQILMAVVVLVLLIACANLANFLLARAATRQRETATRLALGSSRARIIRQSLMETLLLSLSGGLLGLAVAVAATHVLIAFVTQGNTYTDLSPAPDLTILLFTLAVSLVTGLLFGLAPAITSAHTTAAGTLSSSARTAQSSGGRASRMWPKVLVTLQITLSLFLLVGAGLFLRSFHNLQNQDYGFERTHLLLANFNAPLAGYKPSQTADLHQQLIERLSALPGVRSVALAIGPPAWAGNWSSSIHPSGYTPAPKENMNSSLNRVSGRYFETAGISILSGRGISDADTATGFKAAVVSESIAKHYFPKGDALGHSITIDLDSVEGPWQIVGIARDSKSGNPREKDPVRMTYIALAQIEPFVPASSGPPPPDTKAAVQPPEENEDRFANTILLRTTGDPSNTIADLRATVASIDANLPLLNIVTIREQMSSLMTNDELISTLTALFSLLALLLAAIGLYGVMSYNLVRRTNEIGIRFALGAQVPTVLWMVLRESLLLLLLGLSLGLPLTLAAIRVIRNQLFGISPFDSVTFAAAIGVVSAMTLFAAWLPARRAGKVNPMVALRCD